MALLSVPEQANQQPCPLVIPTRSAFVSRPHPAFGLADDYCRPGDTGAPSHSSYHLPRLVWLALLAFLSWTILGRLFDRSQPTASTLDELTTGSWRPRKERLDSLEDVRALIKNSDKAQGFECEDGGDARRVAAASYEFVPSSGRLVWTWDQEQVVRYLLSSPEGLLIVGGAPSPLPAFNAC